MKKLTAILLSVIMMFSFIAVPASALDDVIGNVGENMGFEPDTPIIYGIVYEMETLGGVSIMYKPSPTFSFTSPGTYTVTSDTPLSVDYEFVCWEHEETGKLYYPGDKLYIDGQETLIAVWTEKTDGHIRTTRVILTALETLRRTIGAFFGFYKVIEDFKADLEKPQEPAPEQFSIAGIPQIYHTDADYEANPREYKLLLKTTAYTFEANRADYQVVFVNDTYPTGEKFPAYFTVTDETITVDGVAYQYIRLTLIDGVPNPTTGTRITVTIPEGFLKADGKVNSALTLEPFFVSSYV